MSSQDEFFGFEPKEAGMTVKKTVIFLIFLFFTAQCCSIHVNSLQNTTELIRKTESIQAGRNYHLAEEVFLHDLEDKLTRQELAMLMISLLDKLSYKNIKKVGEVLQVFYEYKDRPSPTPKYVPYIYLASKAGIMESETKSRFNPFGKVTRQMFASVLLKSMKLAKPFSIFYIKDDIQVSDDAKILPWARSGIIYAYKNQWMDVNNKNEINPKGYIKKWQALEIIYQVLMDAKVVKKLSTIELKRAMGESPLLAFQGKKGKWGYGDRDGNVVIYPCFEMSRNFREGMGAVSLNKKWGFIDTAGNWVVRPVYDQVRDFHNGYSAVSLGKSYGYIDLTGKLVIQMQFWFDNEFYSGVNDFSEGSSFVKLGIGRYKLIDISGKMLYKQEMTSVRNFSEGLASVVVKGRHLYLNRKGKMIIKLGPEITFAGDFQQNKAAIYSSNHLMSYINKKGKIIKDRE